MNYWRAGRLAMLWQNAHVGLMVLILLLVSSTLVFAPSGWDDWLDKVRYIATKAEKKEYRALNKGGNEQKLQAFRALFWKLRDPDPLTARNQFREQYFRRIAEGNNLFTESSTPGWRTDRGKIYVLLGPPDDMKNDYDRPAARGGIDSFTFNPSERYPSQLWIYRNTPSPTIGSNLEILFLRHAGTGEYKLANKVDLRIDLFTGRRQISRDPMQIYREVLSMKNPLTHSIFRPTGVAERVEDMVEPFEPATSPPLTITQSLEYSIEQSQIERDVREFVQAWEFRRGNLPFQHELHFFKATEGKTWVNVNVGIDRVGLEGDRPNVGVYAWLEGPLRSQKGGPPSETQQPNPLVYAFEKQDSFTSLGKEDGSQLIFQAGYPIPPGRYHLMILVTDRRAGVLDSHTSNIRVPDYADVLALSSLILANDIGWKPPDEEDEASVNVHPGGEGEAEADEDEELLSSDPYQDDQGPMEPFQVGRFRVEPRMDWSFEEGLDSQLLVFFQVYNAEANEEGRHDLTIRHTFFYRERGSFRPVGIDLVRQNLSFTSFGLPFKIIDRLPPGEWRLRIEVIDNVTGERTSQHMDFQKTGEHASLMEEEGE